MARTAAAERYAKALFQLAKENGNVTGIRDELRDLGALLDGNDELSRVLLQPIYPAGERRGVLNAVADKLGASPVLKSFYSFLIDQRRLVDLAAIEESYGGLADADAGLSKATVRTAAPLTDDQRSRLQRALSARAGHEVELDVEIDAKLVGGIVAQIGDTVFDGSLRSQLEQLRASLSKS